MGVEKETINLIALKNVHGACKQPQSRALSPAQVVVMDGCLSRRGKV